MIKRITKNLFFSIHIASGKNFFDRYFFIIDKTLNSRYKTFFHIYEYTSDSHPDKKIYGITIWSIQFKIGIISK